MRRRRGWRWVPILPILPILGACSAGADDAEPYGAAEFDSGDPVSVDEFVGRPVLLAGWATWCVPCERELPELDTYVDERAAEDLVVVAVNIDERTVGDDDIAAMLQRLDVSLTTWRDPDGSLLTQFGGSLMPFSVLLDRDGEVSTTWIGALDVDDDEFVEAIASVID